MLRKAIMLIVAIVFLIQLIPTSTDALSCATLPTVEEAYEKYDGVVLGHVDKVVQNGTRNEVHVSVTKSFKGVDVSKISFFESDMWGSMGEPSAVGEEYVYFLKRLGDQWENPLCSPTILAADAAEHLEYLQDKEIPIKQVKTTSMPWMAATIAVIAFIGFITLGRKWNRSN